MSRNSNNPRLCSFLPKSRMLNNDNIENYVTLNRIIRSSFHLNISRKHYYKRKANNNQLPISPKRGSNPVLVNRNAINWIPDIKKQIETLSREAKHSRSSSTITTLKNKSKRKNYVYTNQHQISGNSPRINSLNKLPGLVKKPSKVKMETRRVILDINSFIYNAEKELKKKKCIRIHENLMEINENNSLRGKNHNIIENKLVQTLNKYEVYNREILNAISKLKPFKIPEIINDSKNQAVGEKVLCFLLSGRTSAAVHCLEQDHNLARYNDLVDFKILYSAGKIVSIWSLEVVMNLHSEIYLNMEQISISQIYLIERLFTLQQN